MSLQDQGRYLEAIGVLVGDDAAAAVSIGELIAHVHETTQRGDPEQRTQRNLAALYESGVIAVGADGTHVALTPKGLWHLGKGERPSRV
jgi:hypothetical protein